MMAPHIHPGKEKPNFQADIPELLKMFVLGKEDGKPHIELFVLRGKESVSP
jgi:hypothetical protein